MRALIVTNMWPTPERRALGVFVRDQVAALRALPGVEVDVFAFAPGDYLRAAREIRRRHRGIAYDVVHAHFGLTAWPALAVRGAPHVVTLHGTDVHHPRSRLLTRGALRFVDLVAAASDDLAADARGLAGGRSVAVLPCGVDLSRFHPVARAQARAQLGLAADEPFILFPADPDRPAKRFDRALAVAGAVRVHALRDVDPDVVPLWVNAADAVLVPSEREGFGLAVLEALACNVPVIATPVGIHSEALQGVAGTLCGPFDQATWSAALQATFDRGGRPIAGRDRAGRWSAQEMAARVLAAWRELLASGTGGSQGDRAVA